MIFATLSKMILTTLLTADAYNSLKKIKLLSLSPVWLTGLSGNILNSLSDLEVKMKQGKKNNKITMMMKKLKIRQAKRNIQITRSTFVF